jgi:hypothetical protein
LVGHTCSKYNEVEFWELTRKFLKETGWKTKAKSLKWFKNYREQNK